ncbi:MAG: WecB/TagA/CpsF family glycosyltransferase [Patescibacteria group bacterium]
MKLNILGIEIDNVTRAEAIGMIAGFLHSNERRYITTTNPEFIMAARHDVEFRHILNNADLSVADGMGIVFAAKRHGQSLKARIPGVDLLWDIVRLAEQEGKSIFLLGSKRGVPERAAMAIKNRNPEAVIAGAECGYRRWHRQMKAHKLVAMINRAKPDILFVAFGQVKQEKWIYHNLSKLETVKVAMGVGGSFDYIAGEVKRAPQWMRSAGIEWLYRLIVQPWRLPRIATAVVRFSFTVLFSKKR